ncbi:diguanylate cyclase [Lacticaseibacillus thailandensis]|nr:diguanylate cyclase [Lacticaseibacillus thailandensis]
MSINQIQPQIVQLVVMTFFITSFIGFYANYWHRLVTLRRTDPQGQFSRLLLSLGIVAVGIVLFVTARMVGQYNAITYTNGALIMLAAVLFDTATTRTEYAIRVDGLLIVWLTAHWSNITSANTIIATVLLIAALTGIRRYTNMIRHNPALTVGLAAVGAAGFWLTLPARSPLGPAGSPTSLVLAIGTLIAMAAILSLYWTYLEHLRAKAATAKNNVLTTADTYERYEHHMTDAFNYSQGHAGVFTMAVLDIDHFTRINANYGHMGGNSILLALTQLLEDTLHPYGDAAEILRTGGQEFMIVVKDVTADDAMPIIVACWEAVRTHPFQYKDDQIAITVSVGVTTMQPSDESVEDTYQRATINLQESKRSGRDVITVDGQVYGQHHRAHHAELAYFGQGIYDVTGGDPQIVHNELLLRQYDANHDRWVLPESFDIGVGTQIDLLRRFLRYATCKSVTLNLTADEFSDATVATALTLFHQRSEGPHELIVEIMDAPSLNFVREISSIYHAGGVKIYIDDVGSDNSFELVHKLFPYVDGVKFAMQNLRKTATFDQMAERIKFWTGIAQQNHLEFILEGVETQYEMAFDHSHFGVQLEQGY